MSNYSMNLQQIFQACMGKIKQANKNTFKVFFKRLQQIKKSKYGGLLLLKEFQYCFSDDKILSAEFNKILKKTL